MNSLPRWATILLTVISSSITGLASYHFFTEGSKASMILSLVSLVFTSLIAALGLPLAPPKPVPLTSVPKDE